MNEEVNQNSIDTHVDRMRQYYNGYKFRTTKDDGIYSTNLCLDYLQQLLMNYPIPLVDPNNELSKSLLMFIGNHPDSIPLLAQLLENNEMPFHHTEIQASLCLADLIDNRSQSNLSLQSFLFYAGALTFADKPGFLCMPNVIVTKTIIECIIQLCHICTSSHVFKDAVNDLVANDNISSLCYYLEECLKNMIKQGNLRSDNELVTKMLFHSSLSTIPRYLSDTEVEVPTISVYGQKVQQANGYVDLLIAEAKPASHGAMPKRFIIEFKTKGVNYLNLPNR
ncbi:7687_t:CDS:1, partial [Paraglomus brasilianum]